MKNIQAAVRMFMTSLALLGMATACLGRSPQVCSDKLPDKLADAWRKKDPAAVGLVRKVLEDSLDKTYCYDLAARDNAFDLIYDLKLVKMVPLLREVAAMGYKAKRDYQQTWDLESIRRSLDILTQLRDSSAIELNRKRIASDAWLQVVAVRNLAELKSWESTVEIMNLLRDISLDVEHQNVIIAALGFLRQSPQANSSICPRVNATATTFVDCFSDQNVGWRCGDLVRSVDALNEKFHCRVTAGVRKK